MNINFDLYKIFYTVSKYGNITKAAEELYISQPAVSKAIKNLESNLGGKLFNRTKKGVILTEEGKEFYNYIEKAMEYINNAENKFNDLINLEVGTIKIGVSATLTKYFLMPYIKKFNELHPKINIQIYTNLTKDLMKNLKDGLIDIIILNLPYLKDDEIIIEKCKKIQDIFVGNKKYKDLIDREISLKDLNNYPLILQPSNSNTRTFLNNFTKENNVILKPSMELASYGLVTEFTKIGLGIGYLTKDYIKDELNNNELFEINLKEKVPPRNIGIAYSNKNLPSFATKELIRIIKKNVQ
ncbi:MAG: LysR family transcriptional regulator [Bacilli bacterium]|nr:LysR family transcriptional regulator [Bacilli bacterium]